MHAWHGTLSLCVIPKKEVSEPECSFYLNEEKYDCIRKHGGETINERRIQTNTQETDGSLSRGSEETTNRHSIYSLHLTRRRASLLSVEMLAMLVIVSVPFSVHAGVFARLQGFFTETAKAQTVTTTQQNPADIELLSATKNADPAAALGGGDILVENGALMPNIPFGNDVYDKVDNHGEISVYTVRPGDSLSQIAEMFGVTTNTILWANDLSKATDIHPGDSLVILPIVGIRHVVKDGEDINSIAEKYDADASEILAYNQVDAGSLSAGETLIIPGGTMHTSAPAKSTSGGSHANIPAVAPTGSGGSGYYTNPLPGAIRTQGIHGYNGVDLGAPEGTPIRAAAAGKVIISKSTGWNGGYGHYVVIKHPNGTQTLYAHMTKAIVGVGATVSAGETIGYVGSTGRSTGNHLHFEVRGAKNPF